MKVVLTRKLAQWADGVDLRAVHEGDVMELPDSEAQVLIAERWAIPERRVLLGPAPGVERRNPPGYSLPPASGPRTFTRS